MLINHDESRALRIHEDLIVICNWSHPQAAILQVLEEATNTQMRQLGQTLENVNTDLLWLSLSYHDFGERTLNFFSQYALRKALEELEKRGWVEVRYVRENGSLTVYHSNAEAQADKGHMGEIKKQYRFRFDLVQAAIDARFSPEGNDTARGGNLKASDTTPSDYIHSTIDPHTNSTGGK